MSGFNRSISRISSLSDLQKINNELQLYKNNVNYRFPRTQNDEWDHKTRYIYNIDRFSEIQAKAHDLTGDLKDYMLARWFNFWTAQCTEFLFARHKDIDRDDDRYNPICDFLINGIQFDHKTSVFPNRYGKSYQYARENEIDLIRWLYEHQSQNSRRKHYQNRLFVITYSSDGKHWKKKADIEELRLKINQYIMDFDERNLKEPYEGVFADIIWLTDD